jgi:hypothetical protein
MGVPVATGPQRPFTGRTDAAMQPPEIGHSFILQHRSGGIDQESRRTGNDEKLL